MTFSHDERGRPCGLRALGHADFAVSGKDIVCAAVSAILQAARLGLHAHSDAEIEASQKPGELALSVNAADRDRESIRAILATAELAVQQIAQRFPKHVRLVRKRAGEASPSGYKQ